MDKQDTLESCAVCRLPLGFREIIYHYNLECYFQMKRPQDGVNSVWHFVGSGAKFNDN